MPGLGIDLAVLDVNETLTDMTPIGEVFERHGASRADGKLWFSTVLANGFACTMAGTPRTFRDVAAAVLPTVVGRDVPGLADDVFAAFASLPLHPDVADALRRLHTSGRRVVAFTNGAAANTQALMQRSGLGDVVEVSLSVDDAGAWKPDPRSYRYALSTCGVEAERAVMVAVHPWDLHGAAQVGMRTAWIDRADTGLWPSTATPPDARAASLLALAEQFGA